MIPVGTTYLARLVTFVAAGVLSAAALAADPKEKADYERRLDSVRTLGQALERDPAAAGPEVKAALAKADARQKEAAELAGVGEYGLARSVLDEGYQTLKTAIAQTKGGTGYRTPVRADEQPSQDKKADFERELASAVALLEAARRSDAENGNARRGDVARIEKLIAEAKDAAARKDFPAADRLVLQALDAEKRLIANLKGGTGPKAVPASTAPGAEDRERDMRALDEHLRSSRTMLDALKRQNSERKAGKDTLIKAAEQQLARAQSLRGSDTEQALRLANEADASIRGAIQSLQKPSTLKAGSAALEANAKNGRAAGESKKDDLAKTLQSVQALRDAFARQSSARGIDGATTLKRIDQLSADAKRHASSDVDRALKSADEAYQTAKTAIEKLRGG